MAKLRGIRFCRCCCQWGFYSIMIVGVIIYTTREKSWLQPTPCPTQRHFITNYYSSPTPQTCEPCPEQPPPNLEDDPIAKLDLSLGRWDNLRNYKSYDYASVGDAFSKLSENSKVSLATQCSIDRMTELLKIAAHWSGPISVAVFVAGEELKWLRAFATWLYRCRPELFTRLAIHMTIPADNPGKLGSNFESWSSQCEETPPALNGRQLKSSAWRLKNPYPQNHLRNLARKNCHTPYVYLVDIDIIPSNGMAESLEKFFENPPECNLCAYVVPTYELDVRVANFPANKTQLLRLVKKKLAIPFHAKVFIYNQYASNFSKWMENHSNESRETHVSHDVSNFEFFYEPFYVSSDVVPPHDERFIGYGFTRNTQVSMVINRNSFCGGFIISRDYVLTAAHCMRNVAPNGIQMRVGSTRRDTGGQIVTVSTITTHPLYGRPRFDNDISALRLSAPLTLSARVRPVRLPLARQRVPLARLTVTGWGLTAVGSRRIPRVMMEAQVPVVPHWICRLSYGSTLTNNMFCGGHFLIGGVSSCQGDSGGPAIFRGVAFGIVSFARGCALPLSPTVFTNIAALRDWITNTTGI